MERPIHTKFDILVCILSFNVTTKKYLDQLIGSGTFPIIQGSWAHGTSNSHQILYFDLQNLS